MAFGAMGGLAQGLAQGLQMGWDQNERERRAEREAKLDQMAEERQTWARQQAEELQRDREKKNAIENEITKTMSAGKVEDGAAVDYTNADGQQRQAYQPDMQTAEFAARQQQMEEGAAPTAPATPSAPTAQPASSVRTLEGGRQLFTGLGAAADAKRYADENSPSTYARYKMLSEKLAGMAGGQELADQYLARAKAADKEGAFKAFALLEADKPEEALKAWNSTGQMKMGPGQKFVKVTDDKTKTSAWQVVNGDGTVAVPDVQKALIRYIGGPESAVAQAQKQSDLANQMALKKWEYENDPSKRYIQTKAGGQIYDAKTGQFVASNELGFVQATDASGQPIFDSDGDPVMVPGKGGAGAKGAGAGKVPGTVPDAIDKSLKGNEGGIGTATELSAAFRRNDPTMPAETANALGLRAASGANRRSEFNPATGMFDEYFDDKPVLDKDGKPAGFSTGKSYLVQSHQYAPKGVIPDAEAKKAVAQMQAALPKAQFDSYVNASSPDAYKAYTEKANATYTQLATKAKADIEAAKADESLNPQQKVQKIQAIINSAAKVEQDMLADKRRLDLVRQFYQAPPTKPDAGAAGATPSVTDRLAKPGGLGSAVPRDAAQRVAAQEAEAKKRADAEKAAADAKAAADKQARAEIDGLTPQVIGQITDLKTARDLYAKYGMQLDGRQREAFQSLIPRLQQQAVMQRYAPRQ